MKLKYFILSLSLFLLSSCNIQTPFTIVENWLELVRHKDVAGLTAIMIYEDGSPLTEEEVELYLSDFDQLCGEMKTYQVRNFNRLDDPILQAYGVDEGNMVFYRMECTTLSDVNSRVDIVKVGEDWKVSSKKY